MHFIFFKKIYCVIVFIVISYVYGSDVPSQIEGPWDCSPGKCWILPGISVEIENLWNCTRCQQCDYGNFPDGSGGCQDATLYCNSFINLNNKKMIASNEFNSLFTCDEKYFTCKEGYYLSNGECRPCRVVNYGCPIGMHPKRCIDYEGEEQTDSYFCDVCRYPVILDPTMYRYGLGRLFPGCNLESEPNSKSQLMDCSLFLSPKWKHGICNILCVNGYTATSYNNTKGFPNCLLCETSCLPGFKPPDCSNGDGYSLHGGICKPCSDIMLPVNAHWKNHCTWECKQSYYKKWDDSSGNYICELCTITSVCPPNYYFMGCGTMSLGGGCLECSLSCARGEFLDTSIFLNSCKCSSCTNPILGKTFISVNCSNKNDNVFSDCTNYSKYHKDKYLYISKNCSTYKDTVFQNCSLPYRRGLLLYKVCSVYSDSIYIDCPKNKSCNGSFIAFDCPIGKIAIGGVCTCGPATIFNEKDSTCEILKCPPGMYASILTGECDNCTEDYLLRENMQESNPSMFGIDSCRCSAGFFKLISNNSVLCLPCGDMNCFGIMEKQSECDGFSTAEPKCVCGFPPGHFLQSPLWMGKSNESNTTTTTTTTTTTAIDTSDSSVVLNNCNSFTCMYPFQKQESVLLSNALYDEFDFIFYNNPSVKPLQLGHECVQEQWKDVVFLDDEHVIVLTHTGKLLLVQQNYNSMISDCWLLNHTIFLRGGIVRMSIGKVHSLIPHMVRSMGMVWISFSYYGYCGFDEVNTKECVVVELLYFQQALSNSELISSSYCEGLYCIRLGTQIWGRDFSSYGVEGSALHIMFQPSVDENLRMLFLIYNENTFSFSLIDYDVQFYQSETPNAARRSDYPLNPAFYTRQDVFSLKRAQYGLGGIYILCKMDQFFQYKIFHYSLFLSTLLSIEDMGVQIFESSIHTLERSFWNSLIFNDFLIIEDRILWLRGTSMFLDLFTYFTSKESIFEQHISLNKLDRNYEENTFIFFRPKPTYSNSEENMFYWFNSTHLFLMRSKGYDSWIGICEPNHISYTWMSTGTCQPSVCYIRDNACGSNTFRPWNSKFCYCKPGYYQDTNILKSSITMLPLYKDDILVCKPCKENYYCPGGVNDGLSLMFPCPPNSRTHNTLSKSVMDCYCEPGFFHFGLNCVPCPINMWCPLTGTISPIPCNGKGSITEYEGISSPLECICDVRSHGIQCLPCAASKNCVLMKNTGYTLPVLHVLHIQGWFPSFVIASEELDNCMEFILSEFMPYEDKKNMYFVYTMLNDNFMYLKDSLNTNSQESILWNWILILNGENLFNVYNSSLISCMNKRGFVPLEVPFLHFFEPQIAFHMRIEESCGDQYWEWSGDTSGVLSSCTCVAGYEMITTVDWGKQCFPCINGTFRPKQWKGGCILCQNENEEAPYLGMKECICKKGYERTPVENSNNNNRKDLQLSSSSEDENYICSIINNDVEQQSPSWYSILHNRVNVISVTILACILIFMFWYFKVTLNF